MTDVRTNREMIAERYQVVRPLGQGAFATTYEAVELETGRHVAVKETPLESVPSKRTRAGLEHEARVLRSLCHPGIARYTDSFEYRDPSGASFCLVQELGRGPTLWELVQQGARFRDAELATLAGDLLRILDYLHTLEQPVVHRDVKPSNIVRSPSGAVMLVDFGAALEYGQHEPSIVSDGTKGYMAPEQIRGRPTPASDLYGLGATLIYLSTRVEPADLPTRGQRLEFRDRAPISRELGCFIEALVEPKLSRRIPTAAAALVRLHQATARASRRRRRTVRAMALAALVTAGAAVMWSLPGAGAAPRHADETQGTQQTLPAQSRP